MSEQVSYRQRIAAGLHQPDREKWFLEALVWTCLSLALLVVGSGLVFAGFWYLVPVAVIAALFWAGARLLSPLWNSLAVGIFFLLVSLISVFGALPAVWLVGVSLAVLTAWDLDALLRRLYASGRVADKRSFIRHHLARLLFVEFLGALLAAAALTLQVELRFGIVLLLAFLAVLGISLGLRQMKRAR